MASAAGGDAYFEKTLRNEAWRGFEADKRETAIREASAMIGRLSFLRRPPVANLNNATYEQALCLLRREDGTDSEISAAIAQGVKSRSIADASESYATAAERDKDPGWINGVFYCPDALSWLTGYIGTPVRSGRYKMRDWR